MKSHKKLDDLEILASVTLKRPLNLISLKIRPVDFILNYIFEISGFH